DKVTRGVQRLRKHRQVLGFCSSTLIFQYEYVVAHGEAQLPIMFEHQGHCSWLQRQVVAQRYVTHVGRSVDAETDVTPADILAPHDDCLGYAVLHHKGEVAKLGNGQGRHRYIDGSCYSLTCEHR